VLFTAKIAQFRYNTISRKFFFKAFIVRRASEIMNHLRTYGNAPFNVAVIHGGPGAPGGMAPVARQLSVMLGGRGILEPLQTKDSLVGQVQELRTVIETYGEPPVTLVGSSWGAMLSYIFASHFPRLTKKIILVGSGVFEERYAAQILETRLSRLNESEREEAGFLMNQFKNSVPENPNEFLSRLGKVFGRSDAYNPLSEETEVLECQYNIHKKVWEDMRELRISGKLLELGKEIRCPVVALHGDYDPHPLEGIRRPLSSVLDDFRFIEIKCCGHLPWLEKDAREKFFDLLGEELK
jgi:pimeloyl-ACP methyl ester carboxylesterase